MPQFDQHIRDFYRSLELPIRELPGEVGLLDPFRSEEVVELFESFTRKYYTGSQNRIFLIGINPGRLGAGVTGIPFTDPIRLGSELGIANNLDPKPELSSVFIYEMINQFGGPESFYSRCYVTSVSPLGFIRDGKNVNYYDLPELEKSLRSWMMDQMDKQVVLGANREIAFSIGRGKNLAYLKQYNEERGWFKRIEALPHPRWVLQYRRKQKEQFIEEYLQKIRAASS